MKPLIGFMLAWGGYTLMYFGWNSLHGGGLGLVQLAVRQPTAGTSPSTVAGIVAQNPGATVTAPANITNQSGSIFGALGVKNP
jgi:hypothetical protein